MISKKIEKLYIVSLIIGIFIIFFTIYPILNTFGWTDKKIIMDSLKDKEVLAAIFLSMKCATYSMLLSFFLGVPFAYYLARHDFIAKSFIESIIDIPMVLPHTVAGIALLTILAPKSMLGKILEVFNIEVLGTELAIVIAMCFVSLPLMVNSAKDAFKWVPVRMENVSRSLGATHFQTFIIITFRLSWRNILSGMIITWARSLSEFGAVIILAYHPMIAPTLIYERFSTYGLKYSIPVTVILIIISLIIFILLRVISLGKSEKI